jgi:hypothetical protein
MYVIIATWTLPMAATGMFPIAQAGLDVDMFLPSPIGEAETWRYLTISKYCKSYNDN